MEKTAVVQARVDYVTVASLHRFLVEKGLTPQSRSDLIWKTTELLAASLEGSGQMRRFGTLGEAQEYMSRAGVGELNVGRGPRRALIRAAQSEAILAEGLNPEYLANLRVKGSKSGEATVSGLVMGPAETLGAINEFRDSLGLPPLVEIPEGPFKCWKLE